MATGRLLSLAFGPAIAVAMAVPAWAQTTRGVENLPPASAETKDASTRPPSPFNDPAMQLRRLRDQVSTAKSQSGDNNRGGRGGFGGGGGGIQSLLMRSTALQDAIEMTAEQKKAIETLNNTASQQRRDMFQAMRNNNNQGNNDGGRGGRGGGFDPAMMQQMQQMMTTQSQQQKTSLSKILSKKQQNRLNQIRLQILGPLGVAETDVAQALLLTTDQYAQIQQIMQQLEAQRDAMRQAAFNQMRNPGGAGGPGGPGAPGGRGGPGTPTGRGGPGAAPSDRGGSGASATANTQEGQTRGNAPSGNQAQATNNAGNSDNNNNNGRQRGRGGFDPNSPEFKAMMDRMKKMADDDAALEKKAISAIGRILTPKQKSLFNKLLGEPYELAKLVENQGGRGGRGGPGGPTGGPPGTSTRGTTQGSTTTTERSAAQPARNTPR